MGMLGELLITNAFWTWSLNLFIDLCKNYGWAIILFTIVLKLILSPLDYMQRKVTIKNSQMQAIVQPEIAKLQKQYANQKDVINQKTMEIYKKHNYNVVGSCVAMLINMAVTLVVFITLFTSLNNMATINLSNQYSDLKSAYDTAITNSEDANVAVLNEFDDIIERDGFLWIKNLWVADTYKPPMVTYDTFFAQYKKTDEYKAGIDGLSSEQITAYNQTLSDEYEVIRGIVYTDESNTGWNGYFILVLLAGVVSVLSQYVSMSAMKTKNQPKEQQSTGKVMMIVLPIIMVIFTLTSNSMFSLYIITNSAMTALIGYIMGVVIKKTTKPIGEAPVTNVGKSSNVVSYSRNYQQPKAKKVKAKVIENKTNKYFGTAKKDETTKNNNTDNSNKGEK